MVNSPSRRIRAFQVPLLSKQFWIIFDKKKNKKTLHQTRNLFVDTYFLNKTVLSDIKLLIDGLKRLSAPPQVL